MKNISVDRGTVSDRKCDKTTTESWANSSAFLASAVLNFSSNSLILVSFSS